MRSSGRLASAVVLCLLATSLPALGQQTPPAREEPTTKFERFLLAKGTVRVREFYDIGTLRSSYGAAKFEVMRAYTPGRTDYVLALRAEVEESGRLKREAIGVLDEEEVMSLVAALPQMARMRETLSRGQQAQNTEVDFRGGSLQVGFFVSMRGGSRENLYVKAGSIGATTVFFDVSDFPKLEALVSQAATKIQQLKGR